MKKRGEGSVSSARQPRWGGSGDWGESRFSLRRNNPRGLLITRKEQKSWSGYLDYKHPNPTTTPQSKGGGNASSGEWGCCNKNVGGRVKLAVPGGTPADSATLEGKNEQIGGLLTLLPHLMEGGKIAPQKKELGGKTELLLSAILTRDPEGKGVSREG